MIRVDGGTFTMGGTSEQGSDAESDEKPAHQVTLSSYYIGETGSYQLKAFSTESICDMA